MPFDPSRYPADWKEIRARILERAGSRCEWCGVKDRVYRHRETDAIITRRAYLKAGSPREYARIVLTTAHVENPDPMDVRDENLAALCQRCHNRHDAPFRAANAAKTRAESRGQLLLEAV